MSIQNKEQLICKAALARLESYSTETIRSKRKMHCRIYCMLPMCPVSFRLNTSFSQDARPTQNNFHYELKDGYLGIT